MFLTHLYEFVVSPIIFIIECTFFLLYRSLHNPGLAILGVSLVVNVLCLPLYKMADAAQDEERERQSGMAKWVDHIKATFKGDEQYMMLSTYYRLEGYKPIYALRGSFSLLLQIPFFIAAYSYLSNLAILKGASFLFLTDLGAPDQLFTIGGFAVNVLPIAMTLLNVGSTMVYTRGLSLRDKLQAYILALVFLVLLYDSPSGLVMYWTCNQLFSLLKNIFMKVLRHPREVLTVILEVIVFALTALLISHGSLSSAKRVAFFAIAFILFEAVLLKPYLLKERELGLFKTGSWEGSLNPGFVLSALLLAGTVGIVAPAALIGASPVEFMNVRNFVNPLDSIASAASMALGMFLLWVGTYYALSKGETKRAIAGIMWIIAVCGLVDFLFFGRDLGNINSSLVFDNAPAFTTGQYLMNLAILGAVALVLFVIWRRFHQLVAPLLAILLVGALGTSIPNFMRIKADADVMGAEAARLEESGNVRGNSAVEPIFRLSRTGKNVVVLFIDRAQGVYLPYILQERPDLRDTYDGFTYYPNTLSYGQCTIYGAAAIYGGYEYVPTAMNADTSRPLVEKHDEALMLMPTMFSNAGFEVDLNDPPFYHYGFSDVDFSEIEEIPNVRAHHAEWMYTNTLSGEFDVVEHELFRRNLFAYGLFKVSPLVGQRFIYSGGIYLNTTANHAISRDFLGTYAMLANLVGLTAIDDDPTGHLMLLENQTTHMPDYLQLPDYKPALYIDNEGLVDESWYTVDGVTMVMDGDWTYEAHYQANMAAILRIGEWLDYLRAEGCYDNTRIIIVSDHGWPIEQFPNWVFDGGNLPVQGYNPLFMVKDFGAHGFTVSNEFMTNADTPTLAMQGVIDDMENPFTGNEISMDPKTESDPIITTSAHWHANWYVSDDGSYDSDGTYYDTSDGRWYSVHEDIFVEDNWTYLPDYD